MARFNEGSHSFTCQPTRLFTSGMKHTCKLCFKVFKLAPMCFPMWAHWRHLANMIELVLPSAHPSPQPKRQIDRFSRLCTAHVRESLYFTTGNSFPQNCPFPCGIWTPSNTLFLEPIEAYNPNGTSIGSAVFVQMTAECPYTLQSDAPPTLKIAPSHGGSGPPSNTQFPGPN